MAFNYAHGSLQWLTSLALNDTSLSVSGLPFQPKAVRFFWVGLQNAADAASQAVNERRGVGFAVSTSSRRAIGTFSQDTAGTSNCGAAARNDCCVCTTDGAGASDGRLDLNAINSDGFQMIVDDVVPENITVHWEAWGGSDITVAEVGDIAEPAATGNVDYTVTGFVASATDQVVMFAGCQSTSALNTDAAIDSGMHVGFASSGTAADNVTVCGNSDDASAAMDTDGYCQDGECLSMIVGAGGNPNARAQLTQFGTDNFRLNWIARGTTNRRTAFLAIKGGQWRAGSLTINGASASATTTVSGLPFAPIGVSLIGRMTVENTSATATAHDRIGFGVGSSPSSRRSMGVLDENATTSSACEINTVIEYDQVLCYPSLTGTLQTAYDLNAINSDGFQLIVDTAGGFANEWIGYLTFAGLSITGTGTLTAQASVLDGTGLSASSSTDGAITAQDADLTGAGLSTSTGTGTLTASVATLDGTGTVENPAITGSGSLLAQPAAATGNGLSASSGSGVLTTSSTLDGEGLSSTSGTGVLIGQSATMAAAGLTGSSGTGTLAIQSATLAGAGLTASAGTGALLSPSATLDGNGLSLSAGTGALIVQAATLAGSGQTLSTGTGVLIAPSSTVTGTGEAEVSSITGTGALLATAASLSGAGLTVSSGTGTLSAPLSTVSGTGLTRSSGTGVLASSSSLLIGAGLSQSSGTGLLLAQGVTLAGVGTVGDASSSGTGALASVVAHVSGIGLVSTVEPARARIPARLTKAGLRMVRGMPSTDW